MPVITPGEQHGCILFASYVNMMVIAENHICLLVCMLLLCVYEVVCTLVFCDMHAFFKQFFFSILLWTWTFQTFF